MMNQKTKLIKKIILTISIIIILAFSFILILFAIFYNKYDLNIDKLTSLNNGIKVYSASGEDDTLYNTNRSIVEIESLPEYVINAFIDIEDKRFYSHKGYDPKRILKAFVVNATTKSKSQGASTISQQLIKNAILTDEKTYSRKFKEVILASKMEKKFTKLEILEMYLNTIYFGYNAYGIENASKIYFNKSAGELNLNEACTLAGIIKSPKAYSPKSNYDNAVKRKNLVAKVMLDCKHISNSQYESVLSSPIELSTNDDIDHSYEEEAIIEATELLNISERELINRKYEIVTFKDKNLQEQVILANKSKIDSCENSYNTNLDSMSIVAENDGKVVAYYCNSPYNLHNMKRQPASTLKPLAVYLPCIIHNILSPATPILDEKIDYAGFSPKNADNTYHGYVSTKEALSQSLNIPAVKALDYVGLNKSRNTLTDLGINIDNSDLNLSLALGAMKYGVNLLNLLNAYTTIASGGSYNELTFVDKILDSSGNIIYEHSDYSLRKIDEQSCYLLSYMLKQSADTGTAKRLSSLNLPIASKTGTAYNGKSNTDLYNIAYSTEHTLLTWVANIKDEALPSDMYSSVEPTDINKDILSKLYSNKNLNDFAIPEGVEKYAYDLVEYETNHRIIAPTTEIERYIAYDYFKSDCPPIFESKDTDIVLDVKLDKLGSIITFNATKNHKYELCRTDSRGESVIATITDKTGTVELIDNDVFNFDEIKYVLRSNDMSSEVITIRPKDYLITLLNNEFLSGKKRWSV